MTGTITIAALMLHALLGQMFPFPGPGLPVTSTPAVSWTLVQYPHNWTCAGSGTSLGCTVTLTQSTTAGHLLVLLSATWSNSTSAFGTPSLYSASGDSTWTVCPSSYVAWHEVAVTQHWLASGCYYILSASGGASSVAVTWHYGASASVDVDAVLLEFNRGAGTASYDTGNASTVDMHTNPYAGPSMTLGGTKDVVIQWAAIQTNFSAIASPYATSPSPIYENSNVEGAFAWALNQTSAAIASWTDSNSEALTMSEVAFK